MSQSPIRIIPWGADFTSALADILASEHADALADCRIIFPHHRPARYLMARLAAHPTLPKPLLAPRCQTFGELIGELRRGLCPENLRTAGPLDRAALLHEAVRDLRADLPGLLAGLELKTERFLPWGIRLAALLDELMRHGLPPRDLLLDEEEALPEARALLGHIEAVYETYLAALAREGLTTEGNDCRLVLDRLDDTPALLAGQRVLICGFYALSGAEDALFRRLWETGMAEVLWHSDPAVASAGAAVQWSCAEHSAWARRWDAKLHGELENFSKPAPRLRFVEGYDRHSELTALAKELAALPEDQAAAVVLPDEALLPPVLHHLPERECNISMGYPLERASLAQLVDSILVLAENTENDRCRRRDLSALIRHPYLKMLVLPGEESERPLRAVFRQWERQLRASGGRVDPHGFPVDYAALGLEERVAETDALRQAVIARSIDAFAATTTLAGLAEALGGLISLLVSHGGNLWRDHLLDAECLCRLREAVLPALRTTRLAHEPLGRHTLHAILRELIRLERVPFEPDPITGLQVVGMLETRLLRFSRLYLLEALEERLPGGAGHDPLLPDSLRGRLGLPDTAARDTVAAYTFFRLLAGADEAVLLYRQGDAPGLLDATPTRSRFVEMLLWEEEQRRGKLIKAGEPPVERVTLPLSPLRVEALAIEKSEAVRSALRERLDRHGLSPSALDAYMKCPKAFFLTQVCGLRAPDEVGEDGDPAALGTVTHGVLQRFLEPHVGRVMEIAALSADQLVEDFSLALRTEPFFAAMPYDARLILERTGRERLRRFVSNQPRTTIEALEQTVEARVPFAGGTVRLHGRVDRIDLRDGERMVIDYKTGRVQKAKKGLWNAPELWRTLADWRPEDGPEADPLERLADLTGSTQMPLYMLLAGDGEKVPPARAAWVELAADGKEIPYFPARMSEETRREFVDIRTPEILAFLLRHMAEAPAFAPQPGERCRHCDVRGACGA